MYAGRNVKFVCLSEADATAAQFAEKFGRRYLAFEKAITGFRLFSPGEFHGCVIRQGVLNVAAFAVRTQRKADFLQSRQRKPTLRPKCQPRLQLERNARPIFCNRGPSEECWETGRAGRRGIPTKYWIRILKYQVRLRRLLKECLRIVEKDTGRQSRQVQSKYLHPM